MSLLDPTFESTEEISQMDEMSIEDLSSLEGNGSAAGEPAMGIAQSAEIQEEIPPQKTHPVIPQKAPPFDKKVPPLKKRMVSGRYRGTLGVYQLELRVDVDRIKPMSRISGDFYQTVGNTITYFGSFVVNSPVISGTDIQVTIKGSGDFTFVTMAPIVQVTIQRRFLMRSPASAVVQFFTTSGQPGTAYTCQFESSYFRTVRFETDVVSDVTTPVLSSYNTGTLPSGGPARILNVISAYAEAGIEMVPTAGTDKIDIKEANDKSWSNSELHSSMVKHFSLWRDLPQWAVWLLVAQHHDFGSGLYGIMFDQQGKHRQGCAVFHEGLGGVTPEKQRLQLFTYVHDLGHCFNLMHSWQKMYANPPAPNRPCALSWMNYPWSYPSCHGEPAGQATFWNRFPFQFDNEEIIHLRHAFLNNIVMGGNNFTIGAAIGREIMADPIRDTSGLIFKISTHQKSFGLGEPVVLELELGTTAMNGKHIHSWLHPNCGLVKIVIQKPSGEVVSYEPLIDQIVGPQIKNLTREETVKDSAYIGYGKGGFYFGMPGNYKVRAVYAAIDGSEILSDIINIRVRYPVSKDEDTLADMFMGEDQGTLLYLLGSDSEHLKHGNDVFDEVLERYPKHKLSTYIRMIKGINAGRDFKTIREDKATRLDVRPAKLEESTKLLYTISETNVLDPVTSEMVLVNVARNQTKLGDTDAAKNTLDALSAMKAEHFIRQ